MAYWLQMQHLAVSTADAAANGDGSLSRWTNDLFTDRWLPTPGQVWDPGVHTKLPTRKPS